MPRESRGLHRARGLYLFPNAMPPLGSRTGQEQGSGQGSDQGGHVEEGRHELLRDQAHEVLEGLLLRLRVGAKLIRPS